MFFTFFIFYKWYQIVQNITYSPSKKTAVSLFDQNINRIQICNDTRKYFSVTKCNLGQGNFSNTKTWTAKMITFAEKQLYE